MGSGVILLGLVALARRIRARGSRQGCRRRGGGDDSDSEVVEAEASLQGEYRGLSQHEVSQRMLVTEAFSVDPIGIIDFNMP
jgi:hypothetical protein